jgi:hypothetical protein
MWGVLSGKKGAWPYVRDFAKLEALTKASYLALLIVPMIAAFWPAVRGALNAYNQTLDTAELKVVNVMEHVESVKNSLSSEAHETANDKDAAPSNAVEKTLVAAKDTIDNSTAKTDIAALNEVVHSLKSAHVKRTSLPLSWVLIYVAALGVFLGHTVFQARCPRTVQEFSLAEYKKRRVDELLNHGVFADEAVAFERLKASPIKVKAMSKDGGGLRFAPVSALDSLKARAQHYFINRGDIGADQAAELLRKAAQESGLEPKHHDAFMDAFRRNRNELLSEMSHSDGSELSNEDKREAMSTAAESEYENYAQTHAMSGYAAMCMYWTGLLAILGALFLQILTVYHAATT